MRHLFILTLLLVSCTPQAMEGRPDYCAQDNRICPDGSIVMRTGENCEFVCPEAPKDACGYVEEDRQYWHHDLRECQYTKPNCKPPYSEAFSDKCGCGCQKPM